MPKRKHDEEDDNDGGGVPTVANKSKSVLPLSAERRRQRAKAKAWHVRMQRQEKKDAVAASKLKKKKEAAAAAAAATAAAAAARAKLPSVELDVTDDDDDDDESMSLSPSPPIHPPATKRSRLSEPTRRPTRPTRPTRTPTRAAPRPASSSRSVPQKTATRAVAATAANRSLSRSLSPSLRHHHHRQLQRRSLRSAAMTRDDLIQARAIEKARARDRLAKEKKKMMTPRHHHRRQQTVAEHAQPQPPPPPPPSTTTETAPRDTTAAAFRRRSSPSAPRIRRGGGGEGEAVQTTTTTTDNNTAAYKNAIAAIQTLASAAGATPPTQQPKQQHNDDDDDDGEGEEFPSFDGDRSYCDDEDEDEDEDNDDNDDDDDDDNEEEQEDEVGAPHCADHHDHPPPRPSSACGSFWSLCKFLLFGLLALRVFAFWWRGGWNRASVIVGGGGGQVVPPPCFLDSSTSVGSEQAMIGHNDDVSNNSGEVPTLAKHCRDVTRKSEWVACPAGGYCSRGVFSHCLDTDWYEISHNGKDSSCVFTAQANKTIAAVMETLQEWSIRDCCSSSSSSSSSSWENNNNDDDRLSSPAAHQHRGVGGCRERPLFRLDLLLSATGTGVSTTSPPYDKDDGDDSGSGDDHLLLRLLQIQNEEQNAFLLEKMKLHDGDNESSEEELFFVGLHPDQPLDIPAICVMKHIAWSMFQNVTATVSDRFHTAPVTSTGTVLMTLLTCWKIIVFVFRRRQYHKDRSDLRRDRKLVREDVWELLLRDATVAHDCLSVRDTIMWKRFNDSRAARSRFQNTVWKLVVHDIEQDSRIRKVRTVRNHCNGDDNGGGRGSSSRRSRILWQWNG